MGRASPASSSSRYRGAAGVVAVGQEGQGAAVRRPSRRRVGPRPAGRLAGARAVGLGDPDPAQNPLFGAAERLLHAERDPTVAAAHVRICVVQMEAPYATSRTVVVSRMQSPAPRLLKKRDPDAVGQSVRRTAILGDQFGGGLGGRRRCCWCGRQLCGQRPGRAAHRWRPRRARRGTLATYGSRSRWPLFGIAGRCAAEPAGGPCARAGFGLVLFLSQEAVAAVVLLLDQNASGICFMASRAVHCRQLLIGLCRIPSGVLRSNVSHEALSPGGIRGYLAPSRSTLASGRDSRSGSSLSLPSDAPPSEMTTPPFCPFSGPSFCPSCAVPRRRGTATNGPRIAAPRARWRPWP